MHYRALSEAFLKSLYVILDLLFLFRGKCLLVICIGSSDRLK